VALGLAAAPFSWGIDMLNRPFLTIRYVDSFFFSLDVRHPGDVKIALGSFPTRDVALEVGLSQARKTGVALFEESKDGLTPLYDPRGAA
jgi:hypothetical protein